MANNIIPFLVSENGEINLDKTVDKFSDACAEYIASQKADEFLVSACLKEVFVQYKGAKLNRAAITTAVIGKMVVKSPELSDPKVYPLLSKRIGNVIKSQVEAGILGTEKGPNGGTFVIADQAPPPPPKA